MYRLNIYNSDGERLGAPLTRQEDISKVREIGLSYFKENISLVKEHRWLLVIQQEIGRSFTPVERLRDDGVWRKLS